MTGRQRLVVVLAFGMTALSGPVLALAGAAPSGPLVVVVSAPGAEARDAMIRRAGGSPVGPVRTPFAGLAMSEAPGFAERLREAGAWIVLDGQRIAQICGLEA